MAAYPSGLWTGINLIILLVMSHSGSCREGSGGKEFG